MAATLAAFEAKIGAIPASLAAATQNSSQEIGASVRKALGDVAQTSQAGADVLTSRVGEIALSLSHAAASVTLKLVARSGGTAVADTQWSIASAHGEAIKESVGALPTHILAPGKYTVSAKHAGQVYQREFTIKAGDAAQVEVVMR